MIYDLFIVAHLSSLEYGIINIWILLYHYFYALSISLLGQNAYSYQHYFQQYIIFLTLRHSEYLQTVRLPPLRGVVSFCIRKKEQVSLSCFIFLTLLHFTVHLFHLDMIPYYTAMAALIFPGIITIDATRPYIGIVGGIIAGILA